MSKFGGTPSDQLDDLLAVGDGGIGTAFVSMGARHPEGGDAEYLAWHALDHRPELHRAPGVRTGLRVVSTPECRAARAASDERFDAVDHVMAYLLADRASFGPFAAVAGALTAGGRMPIGLPSAGIGVYEVAGRAAQPAAGAGADVLPWRPATGAYLLIEEGVAPAADLCAVDGVAGVWWFAGGSNEPFPGDISGLQLTWCFLDGDPVAVGERLAGVVATRSSAAGTVPLLAAPFHTVVPFAWDRHLP